MKPKLAFFFSICFSIAVMAQPTQNPARKTRAQSSFGLHFDFHADENDKQIGKTLTEGMIDSLLTTVKPDFIQIDCKGHPGYTSYPTKVGNQAGGYTQDPLKLFRKVTAKHGVALYVHYSGVLDGRAVELHPNWAAKNAEGVADKQQTSRQSAYVDSLMIPQLKEIADYGVDGAWVDGDNWATKRDYSDLAIADFKNKTRITTIPIKPEDAGWAEFTQFTRASFKTYLRKYVDAIHAYKPGFQITSNWSYTGFMPEPVDANIDFISGDVASNSGVYSAAFESRCIAPQGKPWDLMSWGFSYTFSNSFGSPKNPIALMQEASEVIALGGGYQVYYTQNRDASLKPWQFPGMAKIGNFCRERQPFCKDAKQVPQIAVIYSTYAFYKFAKIIFDYNPDVIANEAKGITMSLLDKAFSVQVLHEHHIKGHLQEYPVIVIPGWKELEASFKTELLEYAKNGGSLLITGPEAVDYFKNEIGITSIEKKEEKFLNLGVGGRISTIKAPYCTVKLPENSKIIGGFYSNEDYRSSSVPASAIVPYGKGKIGMIFSNLGASYIWHRTQLGADFLSEVVSGLFKPSISVAGSSYVHVNLTTKDNQTFIHLINSAGQHDNEKVFEWAEIPPLYNLNIEYKTSIKPSKLILQPEGKKLSFKFKDGVVSFVVPKLDIYSIVQVN